MRITGWIADALVVFASESGVRVPKKGRTIAPSGTSMWIGWGLGIGWLGGLRRTRVAFSGWWQPRIDTPIAGVWHPGGERVQRGGSTRIQCDRGGFRILPITRSLVASRPHQTESGQADAGRPVEERGTHNWIIADIRPELPLETAETGAKSSRGLRKNGGLGKAPDPLDPRRPQQASEWSYAVPAPSGQSHSAPPTSAEPGAVGATYRPTLECQG